MRLAVISDIHGNLAAFLEVLADIDRAGVDACVSLGDNVGYYPNPEEVLALIQKRDIPSVMGNHELAVTDERYLNWFNSLARRAVELTQELLSVESLVYCSRLPQSLVFGGCLHVHGCPPASVLKYIFEVQDRSLIKIFDSLEQEICFVGHTHFLEVIRYKDGRIKRNQVNPGIIVLDDRHRYIINVGSVGQPRDPFNREAKYVIWDDSARELEIRSVPYDIGTTADKILKLGWPRYLADRLW